MRLWSFAFGLLAPRRHVAVVVLFAACVWGTAALAQSGARANIVMPPGASAAKPAPQAAPVQPDAIAGTVDADRESGGADAEADVDTDDAADDDAEAESHDVSAAGGAAIVYTNQWSDAELARRFVEELPSLGTISVGFADEGRLINAAKMPSGEAWEVISPQDAYGTQEAIDGIVAAANEVKHAFPSSAPLRVNHISKKDGGYLRPHKSHQSGRDVDLGFYYKDDASPVGMGRNRASRIDAARNWLLVKALAAHSDVQLILTDRAIIRVLREYALASGEDATFVDSLVSGRSDSLVRHARRHRDHFHVRFYAPRSQEVGRRIQPILAQRPDENIVMYRVRRGDTLGHIALRFGSSVSMIQKANAMRGSFLRVARTLAVPLRGPCTHCPQPPPVVVPPRRLPPTSAVGAVASSERRVASAPKGPVEPERPIPWRAACGFSALDVHRYERCLP